MDTLDQITRQISIEEQYSRKHIDSMIKAEIHADPIMMDKLNAGTLLVQQYMMQTYYDSKNRRIAQLVSLDIPNLVLDIFVGVAYCTKPELFTSITAMMAGRLKFSDKADAIKTVAEIMAVLCQTDAFDILKTDRMASLAIVSRIPLSATLIHYIDQSQYLPPMVCAPLEVTSNYTSGYLTHNDSLVLGKGNHHNGDLCLDVINLLNQIPLSLDTSLLSKLEEDPTFDLDTPEKRQHWDAFKRQSYEFYLMLAQYGNRFYLTHKVDKRGRIYAQGYHINTQGTAFKKAMVELAETEVITGVPHAKST